MEYGQNHEQTHPNSSGSPGFSPSFHNKNGSPCPNKNPGARRRSSGQLGHGPPRTRASECSTCQALEKKPIWVNLITTEACSPEAWNHGECIGKSLGKENPGDTLW